MAPEEAREGHRRMEFTQVSGPPLESVAQGCLCSYTWGPDGRPVRNGPVESCRALHPEDVTVTVGGGEPVQGEWGHFETVPGLEERVTALEERLAYPMMITAAPEVSDEEAEKFRADWERLLAVPGVRLLPPAPVLTPETAEALLRQCVTVVKPGETLLIRIPDTWHPQQVYETQRRLSEVIADRELGFTVLLVPGEDFAVARPGDGIPESRNPA